MKRLMIFSYLLLVLSLAPLALAQAPATTITVEGQLVKATPGETVEAGIPVMLHSYDDQQISSIIEGVTGLEGTFRFENVEAAEGRIFEVMATVGRTIYFSERMTGPSDQTRLELPVTIYDTTTDASAVRIEQMHTIVEFPSPAQMQVLEVYVISNDGDRTVEGAFTLDDGRTASLRFTLPEGATGLSFEGDRAGDRFIPTADGFADTRGVPPGSGTIQFTVSYLLPYRDGMHFERALFYPADDLSVILPQGGVSLTSDTLTPRGSRQMPDGRVVDVFAVKGFEPGESLVFELSGQPQVSRTDSPSASFAQPAVNWTAALVGLGLAALGLALIGYGIWWWRRGTTSPGSVSSLASTVEPETPEAVLIRAIAKLDEGYQTGIIPQDDYTRKRTTLRTELKTLLIHCRRADLRISADIDEREVTAEMGTGIEDS